MRLRNILTGSVISTGLLLGAASPAFAQTDNATVVAQETDDGGSDKTGLWGLLGLAGLAGLAGLKRRRDETDPYRTTTGRGTGASSAN